MGEFFCSCRVCGEATSDYRKGGDCGNCECPLCYDCYYSMKSKYGKHEDGYGTSKCNACDEELEASTLQARKNVIQKILSNYKIIISDEHMEEIIMNCTD